MTTRMTSVVVVVVVLGGIVGAYVLPRLASNRNADADAASIDTSTLQNLRAFAKLYGYVRYFHPSDRASAIDWDRFAILGVSRILGADQEASLQTVLQSLFLPVAPTLQIYPQLEPPPQPVPTAPSSDTADLRPVYWQHRGVGLGNPGPYRSIRVNREVTEKTAPSSASFWKRMDATPFRGKDLRLTASVRSDVYGEGNEAQVFLYDEVLDFQHPFYEHARITANEWTDYSLTGRVGSKSDSIGIGGTLMGSGTAWFDDYHLEIRAEGDDIWTTVDLSNAGFEERTGQGFPKGWRAWGPGYQIETDPSTSKHGNSSLRLQFIDSVPIATPMFDAHPAPGETWTGALGAGLAAQIPLVLYSLDGQILEPEDAPPLSTIQEALSVIDEEAAADSRVWIADVVILWNVLQHFYPLFEVTDADWDAVLTEALVRASDGTSTDEFRQTLRWMLAQLNDGHAYVEHLIGENDARPPFLVDEAEGKLVIVAVAPNLGEENCFESGDVVVSIDGVPVAQALDSAERLISGSPQWKRILALREFGTGTRGTVAQFQLTRKGEAVRCGVERSYSGRLHSKRPMPIHEIEAGIYYVNLSVAPMETIEAKLEALASADAVLFDLRGYTARNVSVLRHLTEDTVRSTYWPIPQIIYPDRQNPVGFDTTNGTWVLPPRAPRIRGEVVFLTDANAISQPESVLGIVEHYKLGEIVGQRTAGVTGNANPLTLPGCFKVSWTGMRVLKHNGELHHGSGIVPTLRVNKTADGLIAGRDETFEAALRLIKEKANQDPGF